MLAVARHRSFRAESTNCYPAGRVEWRCVSRRSAQASEIAPARLRPFRIARESSDASRSGSIETMILTLFLRTAIDGCIAAAGFSTGALPASADEAASLAEDDIDLILADMRLPKNGDVGKHGPAH